MKNVTIMLVLIACVGFSTTAHAEDCSVCAGKSGPAQIACLKACTAEAKAEPAKTEETKAQPKVEEPKAQPKAAEAKAPSCEKGSDPVEVDGKIVCVKAGECPDGYTAAGTKDGNIVCSRKEVVSVTETATTSGEVSPQPQDMFWVYGSIGACFVFTFLVLVIMLSIKGKNDGQISGMWNTLAGGLEALRLQVEKKPDMGKVKKMLDLYIGLIDLQREVGEKASPAKKAEEEARLLQEGLAKMRGEVFVSLQQALELKKSALESVIELLAPRPGQVIFDMANDEDADADMRQMAKAKIDKFEKALAEVRTAKQYETAEAELQNAEADLDLAREREQQVRQSLELKMHQAHEARASLKPLRDQIAQKEREIALIR